MCDFCSRIYEYVPTEIKNHVGFAILVKGNNECLYPSIIITFFCSHPALMLIFLTILFCALIVLSLLNEPRHKDNKIRMYKERILSPQHLFIQWKSTISNWPTETLTGYFLILIYSRLNLCINLSPNFSCRYTLKRHSSGVR